MPPPCEIAKRRAAGHPRLRKYTGKEESELKKRLMSMVLVFAMIFSMMGSAIPAMAAETDTSNPGVTFTVKADQSTYTEGDTITYTVTMGPVQNVKTIKLKMSIPKGLEYLSGSAVEGLRDKMNAVKAEYVDQSRVFAFLGDTPYSSETDTPLFTIQCVAKKGSAGTQSVRFLTDKESLQVFDPAGKKIPRTMVDSTVTISEKPVRHSIDVLQNNHGSLKADMIDAFPGTTVTLTRQADEGYHFDKWETSPSDLQITGSGSTWQFVMPNQKVTVKAVFAPDEHTVTVDGVPHKTHYDATLEDILTKEPVLEGHTFTGWTDAEGNKVTPQTIVKGDMEINANWDVNTYTVTIDDYNSTTDHPVKYGKTLAEVLPKENPTREGYTFVRWADEDGNTVTGATQVKGNMTVTAQWKINTYTVTIDGKPIPGVRHGDTLAKVLADNNIQPPEKVGYHFTCWMVGESEISPEAAIVGPADIVSHFEPNTDTKYTVKHMLENLDGMGYTEGRVETLTGTTDTKTAAAAKEFQGFTAGQVNQVNIDPDGSAVVVINYSRNSYNVTIGEKSQMVKYEDTLAGKMPEDPTRVGYTFSGWFADGVEITEKTQVMGEIKAEAKWTPNKDTKYTVRHLLEDLNSDTYTEKATDAMTGTTAEMTKAAAKEFEGFKAQSFEQAEIAADGSTVIEIRYTRDIYDVTLDDVAYGNTFQVEYGDTLGAVLPENPEREGNTFVNWTVNGEAVNAETPVTGPVTVKGNWSLNHYKVTVTYGNNQNKTYPDAAHFTTLDKLLPEDPSWEGHDFMGWFCEGQPVDGSTVVRGPMDIKAEYSIQTYTIFIDGQKHDGVEYGSTLGAILPKNPTKQGYDFAGWFVGEADVNEKEVNSDTVVKGPVQIWSKWTPRNDTPYTVKHMQENLDGSFSVFETDVDPVGTTEGLTAAEAKDYEGFTAQEFEQKTIAADGSTVVEIKYLRNTFTVTIGDKTSKNVKYGTPAKDLMPKNPTKAGYDFAGWFENETEITAETPVKKNITAEAKWTPSTDTKYTVKHMQENLDGTFTTVEETLTGTTEALTAAAAKEYEGFTAQKFDQKQIAADGSTVVEIKYLRNTYTVTIGDKTTKNVKYGTLVGPLMPQQPTQEGYTFAGWVDKDTADRITAETPVKGNITAVATWAANTDTKYVVKHMQQDLEGEGFTEFERDNLKGTTGKQTEAEVNSYPGFTVQPFTQKSIAGDGSTVIEIKYVRDTFKVTVDNGTEKTEQTVRYGTSLSEILPEDPVLEGRNFSGWYVGDEGVTEHTLVTKNMDIVAKWDLKVFTVTVDGQPNKNVPYETSLSTILPENPTKAGYDFDGWYANGEKIDRSDLVKGNMTIESKWTARTDTKYTVKHLIENLDGTFTTEEQALTGTTAQMTEAEAKAMEGFKAQAFDQKKIAGDGSTVIEIKYIRDTFKVTVDGVTTENVKYDAPLSTILPKDPAKVGYDFAGWFSGKQEVTGEDKVHADMTITSKWEASKNTKYTVKHMMENLEDNDFTVQSETLTGTTGAQTAAVAKNVEGFTAQKFEQTEIAADGSTVIEIKYLRDTFTVTIGSNINKNIKYGTPMEELMPEEPTKEGYTFLGWFDGKTEITADSVVKGNINAQPVFAENTDTEYTVKYMLENLDGKGYTQADVETLTGTTGAKTAAEAKNYEGFTAQEIQQQRIAGDGSTVVEIRYTRNTYTVTIGGTTIKDVKYGTVLAGQMPEKPTKVGYTFQGWFDGDTEITDSTVVKGEINAQPKFTANSDTKYVVNHMQENLNDEGYTLFEAEPLTGTTGEMTAAAAKEYKGFTAQKFEQSEIAADGSTVIEIRYTRNNYTVTIGDKTIENVKFGSTLEGRMPEQPVKPGYTFNGWFDGETKITEKTVVEGDITAKADFTANSGIKYTVKHLIENLDGTFTTEEQVLTGTTDAMTAAQAKTLEGLKAQKFEQKKIAADGSTVVEIKYLRDTFTVTIGDKTTLNVKYGTSVKDLMPKQPTKLGYTFAGWFDGKTEITADTVVKANITATAKFNANTDTKYTVKHLLENENGSFDVKDTETLTGTTDGMTKAAAKQYDSYVAQKFEQKKIAADGSTVVEIKYLRDAFTVTVDGVEHKGVKNGSTLAAVLPEVEPKAGHTFAGWFAGETKVNADTVVKDNMTIVSKWDFNVFTDVKQGAWYYEGVRYATFHGLMSGVSGTTFGPDIPMNRAMVVQVLYSMAGKPDVKVTNEFKDVPANEWYAKAVAWAVKEGVASGYGNGMFGANDLINREQLAVMLYSYAGKPAVSGELNFADNNEVSGWAKTAIQWAVENGIMSGVLGNRVAPKDNATRAQAALMMSNFDKLMEK